MDRQLGPLQGNLDREPDIVIRFVDRLSLSSTPRLVGLDDAAYTDDAFLVLRSKYKARARVQIPLDRVGRSCEIVCERGVPAVPLLVPIINLTALGNDAVALHASAFQYRGMDALVTGWAKGGKTEALLAFMRNGASYIGDEWVYLADGGRRMVGLPEPIKLWDWHLSQVPEYRSRVGWRDRARLGGLASVTRLARGARQGGGPRAMMRRAMPLIERQLFVHLAPERLFGEAACRAGGTPERIFFVVSHASERVTVEPIDSDEVAARMAFSLHHERLDLVAYYLKFRFAFPERRNDLLDHVTEREHQQLARMLKGRPSYIVRHPYPIPVAALFDAMAPHLS